MGQGAAKAKQGAEQETQKTGKHKKSAHSSSDADELIAFMKENYNKVEPAKSFDEFYHAIYELIEKFCEERGQLQYRIPSKDDLKKQYEEVHRYSGNANLTLEQFEAIAKGVLNVNSFAFGKAAVDILVILFGLPVCAVVTKRFIPGLKSISDDIVIPVATSGAVAYLAKTNKL